MLKFICGCSDQHVDFGQLENQQNQFLNGTFIHEHLEQCAAS